MAIDLTPQEGDAQVREWYKRLMAQVLELDEQIDAGSEGATERKYANELMKEQDPNSQKVIDALNSQFENLPMEAQFGILYGVQRKLADLRKNYETWLKEAIPTQEKVEPLSDDERKKLAATRSELAKQLKMVVSMAETFNEIKEGEVWDIPQPRRGSIGKRGPRALSLYQWAIDGVELGEDDNSVKGVSQILGFEKVAQFSDYLRSQDVGDGKKFDTGDPPEKFSFTINGKEVSAYRPSEEDEEAAELAGDIQPVETE